MATTETSTTTYSYYEPFRAPKTFKCLGILIAIASILSFVLGIVDVAVTFMKYVTGTTCPSGSSAVVCQQSNLAYTWVGVGIWASIPIFLTGVLAAYLTDNPDKTKKWFTMLAFVSAIIFAPVMIIISSLEAAMANGNYYNNTPYNDYEKLIVPIIIACLGFLEFVMTAILMIRMCCCTEDPIAKRTASTIPTTKVASATNLSPVYVTTGIPSGPVSMTFPNSSTSAMAVVPPNTYLMPGPIFNGNNANYGYSNSNNRSTSIYASGYTAWTPDKNSNFLSITGPTASVPNPYPGSYLFHPR